MMRPTRSSRFGVIATMLWHEAEQWPPANPIVSGCTHRKRRGFCPLPTLEVRQFCEGVSVTRFQNVSPDLLTSCEKTVSNVVSCLVRQCSAGLSVTRLENVSPDLLISCERTTRTQRAPVVCFHWS